MAEADPKDRDAAERLARELDGPVQHRWVPRTVRQNHAVGTGGLDVGPARAVWQHYDATASFPQRAKNVGLDSIVDDRDQEPGAVGVLGPPQLRGQRLEPFLGRGARRFSHQVLLREGRHAARSGGQLGEACLARGFGFVSQHGAQRSMSAQVARQRARVDLGDRRHLPSLQVFVQGGLARVVARDWAGPAHDERSRPWPGRLRVSVTHPVVALQRVRHAHHLSGVRRVGEHLLIARHRRVEHDLSFADDLGAQSNADK